ncbi:MAG: DUF72 domain-containing protein [bacterium]
MNSDNTQFFIGTSGWSYPHWRGIFYPEDQPKNRWFEYYAQQFSTVEVNATFYRFFKDDTFRNWRERAPEGFRYVLKAPRVITHRKYLQEVEQPIQQFWQSAQLLAGKFGVILLQLAPNMPYDPERLRTALLAFEEPSRIAVELRHPRWLTDEIHALLKETGAIFCAADSPDSDLVHWLPSKTAYIRLHGRKSMYAYNYSAHELREIAEFAQKTARLGAKTVYIFFNNDFQGYAPKNAATLSEMLRG